MRRRVVASLLVVVLCFAAGAALAVVSLSRTTATLGRVVELHRIEELRQDLIIAVQTVQADLYAAHTDLGARADLVAGDLDRMAQAARRCSSCHHAPDTAARIDEIAGLMSEYESTIRYYASSSARGERTEELKRDAATLGSRILNATQAMSLQARERLQLASLDASARAGEARKILYATILVAFLIAVGVAARLTISITRPIDRLVEGTRALASGNLGVAIALDDGTEFGALASHFDSMSAALRKGYEELQEQVRERRRAEEALRISEQRLQLALDATSEVVWDWNVREDRIYHPRWAQAYGHPEAVTPRTGAELAAFIHPVDAVLFDEQTRQASQGVRDGLEVEHRVRTGSGEWKWMLARARVVERDAEGRAVRIVGTCADITERRKMVERLQLADRLASMGALAAGVAHEVNNPLAYVIANVDYALERLGAGGGAPDAAGGSAPDPRQAVGDASRALEEARTGAARVRDIVRDLKVFSRADESERGAVDVNGLLLAACRMVDNAVRQRAVLVKDLGEVPLVSANESRLSQVFVNLLVNAAQAIPEGHAAENRIQVRTRVARSGSVAIEVSDTGSGIPPEHRSRIFDPFFTTKPVGVGTGLGLAICHGIVSALGGRIEVETEVGKGSAFRVVLPSAG